MPAWLAGMHAAGMHTTGRQHSGHQEDSASRIQASIRAQRPPGPRRGHRQLQPLCKGLRQREEHAGCNVIAGATTAAGAAHAPGVAVGDIVADGAALCLVGDAHHAVCQVATLQVVPAQTCHLSHISAVPKRLHKLCSCRCAAGGLELASPEGTQPQGGWLRPRATCPHAGEHRCAAVLKPRRGAVQPRAMSRHVGACARAQARQHALDPPSTRPASMAACAPCPHAQQQARERYAQAHPGVTS